MKKVIFTAIVMVFSVTLFAQGGKNKKKNQQINLIPITNQQAIADSLAKVAALDSFNRAIAANNQQKQLAPVVKSNGIFTSDEEFTTFLKKVGGDTTQRAREFKDALKVMNWPIPKGKFSVDTLITEVTGWVDVSPGAQGKYVLRAIPDNIIRTELFIVSYKGKVYHFNKRGTPLKKGTALELVEANERAKITGPAIAAAQKAEERANAALTAIGETQESINNVAGTLEGQAGEIANLKKELKAMKANSDTTKAEVRNLGKIVNQKVSGVEKKLYIGFGILVLLTVIGFVYIRSVVKEASA